MSQLNPLYRPLFICLLVFGMSSPLPLAGQVAIDWESLARVSYSPIDGQVGETVAFAAPLQALDSQEVIITGYMLPLTVDNDRYILSRFPFYNCYFCGNAGRETVIELQPREENWKFDIDEKVRIRGILHLKQEPEALIFELTDAEPIIP